MRWPTRWASPSRRCSRRSPTGPGLDKWVVFVPAENADAVREAMFAAGAGHIGDYSHCSWSVSGTGQFLPHDGASPAIGSVGTVEQVPEDRVEMIAPSAAARPCAGRDARRASLRGTGVRHLRAGARAWRCGTGPNRRRCRGRRPLSAFVSRVHDALPGTSWGVRASGDSEARGVAGRGVRRRGRLAARRRRGRRCAGLRHRRPAAPSRRRTPARIGCGAGRRRALGQ